jgi:hypothetical protein
LRRSASPPRRRLVPLDAWRHDDRRRGQDDNRRLRRQRLGRRRLAGDVVVGASDLFDKRDKQIGARQAGRHRALELRSHQPGPPALHADVLPAARLPDATGPYRDDGTRAFAITGGTGEYRTAHGWMDLTSTTTPDGGQTFVYGERFRVIR